MVKSAINEIQEEANGSIKTETDTSSENENQDERLVSAFEKMFKELEPSVSSECRIFKVPYHLRTLNPKAYTPHVISIGPYHHNNKNCRTMEKHKVRYFQSFMTRVDTEVLNMENLVSTIREMENEIRSCYVETVQLKSDDFVKMIMLDASFILELFLRDYQNDFRNDDPIVVEAWLFYMVSHELLLLENQLPFFVIDELYRLALPSLSKSTSLIRLTFGFFKFFNIHNKAPDHGQQEDTPNHGQQEDTPDHGQQEDILTIEVRDDPNMNTEETHRNEENRLEEIFNFILTFLDKKEDTLELEIQHFTDLLRFFQLPPDDEKQRFPKMTFPKYSITRLHEAGVKFKVASRKWRDCDVPSKCITDLRFDKGVLTIPLLEFSDGVEARVRNIMAFEQCHYSDHRITDFYIMLDQLINTNKDVDLLIENKIVVNYLGNSNAVTSMINKLNRGVILRDMNSDFIKLSIDLNDYYEKIQHRWKAALLHEYLSTPWRAASTIAAIILLILTLIQTVFSILQVV